MVACCQRKNEQDQQVKVHFGALNRHSVLTEQNNAHQLALFGLEPVLQHEANNTFSRWLGKLRAVVFNVLGWRELEDFGATKKKVRPVFWAAYIKLIISVVQKSNAFFDKR